ncbi:MAG: hypothetical protein ACI3VX_04065, partial [Faecousia sp.]
MQILYAPVSMALTVPGVRSPVPILAAGKNIMQTVARQPLHILPHYYLIKSIALLAAMDCNIVHRLQRNDRIGHITALMAKKELTPTGNPVGAIWVYVDKITGRDRQ